MDTVRQRFKDAPWFVENKSDRATCLIGGAGGIGSWLALFLARAGFHPFVFDDDLVEVHNVGGQLYSLKDIGKRKVEALDEILRRQADTTMAYRGERYTSNSMTHIYAFAAFDNMQARKDMFGNWYKEYVVENPNPNALFIDGRLLMEQMQIFCVTPETALRYKNELFDDSEVEDAACTMKQTSHSAAMIASLMTGFFTNHMANKLENMTTREVPYFQEYYIPLNLTTTINLKEEECKQ